MRRIRGRYGWLLLLVVAATWDLLAARTNGESLTYVFRRDIAGTAWRWPVLILIVLLTIHLFLPSSLREYDPIDRLYRRFNPAYSQSSDPHLR